MLHRLEKRYGPLEQRQAVSFRRGLSSNMLNRVMHHALHATGSGGGVAFLMDIAGAAPYRVASLMSHKYPQYEVTSGITHPLLEWVLSPRELLSSSAFHDCTVALGGPDISSLWHQ